MYVGILVRVWNARNSFVACTVSLDPIEYDTNQYYEENCTQSCTKRHEYNNASRMSTIWNVVSEKMLESPKAV